MTRRTRRVLGVLVVAGLIALAGCASSSSTGAQATDDGSLDAPNNPSQAEDTDVVQVVESVKLNGDELLVIHDSVRDTYCYQFNDESGDAMTCLSATAIADDSQAGQLRVVEETSINGENIFVVSDDGRGVTCYLSVDSDADAFDCRPQTDTTETPNE